MLTAFFRYFCLYIGHSKTRQRQLIMALLGLFIASFSLVILQCTMGGLQRGLIKRHKNFQGHGTLYLRTSEEKNHVKGILDYFAKEKISAYAEYELLVMLQNGKNIAASVAHGVDFHHNYPHFLSSENQDGLILGLEFIHKLRVALFSDIKIISATQTDPILGDVPRRVSGIVRGTVSSGLSEIDAHHFWVRSSLLYNLSRKREMNRIKIEDSFDKKNVLEFLKQELNFIDPYLTTW